MCSKMNMQDHWSVLSQDTLQDACSDLGVSEVPCCRLLIRLTDLEQ